MSFAEIFSAGGKKKERVTEPLLDKQEKVLSPITSLFERKLGKERAEQVKSKMMPAIEKIYMKAVNRSEEDNDADSGRKAMQEFLTSYLEAVSDISESSDAETDDVAEIDSLSCSADKAPHFEMHEELSAELEAVGNQDKKTDTISREVHDIEAAEVAEEKEEKVLDKLPNTVFKRAYETMMLSGGDEALMRRELKRITKEMEKDAKLAYSLAKQKFKETRLTHLTKVRDGMRNVNTELLYVKEVENLDYQKSKKHSATVTRMLVRDAEDNEGVIYLFDDRGVFVKAGMAVKVAGGFVKTFKFSNETALTVSKKGNVYIVL